MPMPGGAVLTRTCLRRYSRLALRLLRLRLVPETARLDRSLSFQFLNRQVVWEELHDLLLFLLPVVSQLRLQRPAPPMSLCGAAHSCPLCSQRPALLPTAVQPCGHVGCYFCLAARCRAARDCVCTVCLAPILGLRRLTTDHDVGANEAGT